MDIQKYIEGTSEIILSHTKEAYFVGGGVRDLWVGRTIKDIDFAIPKNPKQIAQKVADYFKCALVVLKEEREIVRVAISEKLQFDFVKFKGKTIQEDLANRDFTINAMALPVKHRPAFGPLGLALTNTKGIKTQNDITKEILDPFNGQGDLKQKIIRQINPEIYRDDPLRMLRAYRMASQLHFEIDPRTIETIQKNKEKIHAVSAERIREEILLLLDPPEAYPYVLQLDASGLVSEILPEMDPNRECALQYYPGKGVWGHSLDGLKYLEWIFKNLPSEFPENHEKMAAFLFGKAPESQSHPRSTLMKMAILLHDIGKAPTAQILEGRMRFFEHQNVGAKISIKIARRLKYSTKATQTLATLVQSHMRAGGLAFVPNLTERAKYRFFRDLGGAAIPMLLVSLADRYTYIPEMVGQNTDPHEKMTKEMVQWHYLKELEQPAKKAKLIDGSILMKELGLPPGPLIGQILKEADEATMTGEIHTPQEALEYCKNWVKKLEKPSSF